MAVVGSPVPKIILLDIRACTVVTLAVSIKIVCEMR